MNRADFYLLATRFRDSPLDCVCLLATKAISNGLATLVLADSIEQAEALDQRLWEFDADAYVGHQIAGQENDDYTPVLIATPDSRAPLRDFIINLRPAIVGAAPKRVAELIIDNEDSRAAARARWQQYRGLGFETHKHDI